MKIKLDENIDLRAKDILTLEGHEVVTVAEEGLIGAPDEDIARFVKQERSGLSVRG
jgi:predicted nuclease of predicted toxin-antitoxin system